MPNFGGSRLGFWFNRQNRKPTPTGTARSDTRGKNALIVYNTYAQLIFGNQILNYYNDPGSLFVRAGYTYSTEFMRDELRSRLQSYGWTVTIVASYDAFLARAPGSNANIAQIWDISFANIIPSNVVNAYTDYLRGGGAICLLGENGDYVPDRGHSMCNLIGTLGGGTVGFYTAYGSLDRPYTSMAEEFKLVWNDPAVYLDWPGYFKNYGSTGRFDQSRGTRILSYPRKTGFYTELDDRVCSAMWKTGSLSVAPTGAVITTFDATHFLFDGVTGTKDHQPNFIENMIFCLDYK